jgi:hypothetical protein
MRVENPDARRFYEIEATHFYFSVKIFSIILGKYSYSKA